MPPEFQVLACKHSRRPEHVDTNIIVKAKQASIRLKKHSHTQFAQGPFELIACTGTPSFLTLNAYFLSNILYTESDGFAHLSVLSPVFSHQDSQGRRRADLCGAHVICIRPRLALPQH